MWITVTFKYQLLTGILEIKIFGYDDDVNIWQEIYAKFLGCELFANNYDTVGLHPKISDKD